jgi:thioredoxin
MITLTGDNFDDTVHADEYVLVDFWAEWCGPCKRMLPILEEADSEGLVLIGKLNVDEYPEKAAEFTVTSIPTMVLFKNGQPVHRMTGAMPKHALLKELEPWI